MSPVFPRRFGKYHLLKPLAQGGMGALYLAVSGDRGMEKLGAVKTVLPHLADKEYLGRFRDEAKVVVKLQHGNLVQVFDAGQVGGELYLAMEFIEGKDLRAVWNRCARKGIAFPLDVAVHIVKELCRGLGYAHDFEHLRLVHRDVSPPNVLLAYSGEVKLTDFGLASSTLKSEKTAPGIVYGKVSYMSPEQARGEVIDGRTDLYTAGILLWELLTGRQLFPQGEKQPGDVLQLVKKPEIDPPSRRASRVTPALDRIVMKALALGRDDRFQTGEEMRMALAEYLAQEAPTTDAARITSFLKELFGEDIEDERRDREMLLKHAREQLAKAQAESTGSTTKAKPKADGSAAGSAAAPALAAGGKNAAAGAPQTAPSTEGTGNLLGTVLDGRYRVRSLVGEGGMGRVYEAEHIEIGKRVAVKVLHPVYSRTPEVVERFRREARSASKIGHPGIVDVTDSGTTQDGSVYFVMEFLEGVELAKVISTEGALDISRSLTIAAQICRAVAAAHAQNIIHRDLKPENIFLVTRDGTADFVKVLDFGIAKTAEIEEARERKLTHPGMAMGTPEYMAPEQAAGKPYDHRIDLYATGAILYEMLCGVAPYEGENFMEVLAKKATQEPVAPRQHRPELPEEVEALVMHALAHDPDQRPPSMEAFDYEITKAMAGRGVAVGKMLGISPEMLEMRTGQVGDEATPISGEMGRSFTTRRVATFGVIGCAVGAVIMLAVVGVQRRVNHAGGVSIVAHEPEITPPHVPLVAGPATARVDPPTLMDQATPPHAQQPDSTAHTQAPERPPAARRPNAVRENMDSHRQLLDARKQLAGGHYPEAKQSFQRLLEMRSERAGAMLGLGEIAFQQANYTSAAKLARKSIGAGGGAPAHVLLGNAYFKQQRFSDAIHEYKVVLRVQPNHPEAKRALEAAERRQATR
jgi:serine/threonine protein kinase